jgi:hypothetical protein
MGTEQSTLADSFNSVNVLFNGTHRNRRQRLYSISTRRRYSLSNVKTPQRFDDNLSTTSTNLSTVSLSTNSCHSRFFDLNSSIVGLFLISFVTKCMLNGL